MKRIATLLLLLSPSISVAAVSGANTLLETPNARPAALGEAFSAATDDISGFSYNPSSLETLKTGQVSFMYQKGLVEDNYGQFMYGAPLKKVGMGLSVGYYNGGDVTIFDGLNEKTVTAKKDLTASLGFASNIGGVSLGIAGKYISSELIESYKATAYAADAGLQMPLSSHIRMGAAIQNIGSEMRYVNESNPLPQIARIGMAFSLFPNSYSTTLSLEAPYYLKDHEMRAGAGLETVVGPLALRVGYRTGNQLAALSFGAGFMMGRMSVDYSYGLVQDLQSSHRISVGVRFGDHAADNKTISQQPTGQLSQINPNNLTKGAVYE